MIPIQIVGYKNSGKTTFSCQLIAALKERKIQVASLKHHGHGGVPLGFENTDSEKHLAAGAVVSGVEGAGVLQLSLSQSIWDIEKILTFYQLMEVELVVIEGFKQQHFGKVVLIREEEDLDLLKQLSNVVAVVSMVAIEQSEQYQVFETSDAAINWIMHNLHLFAKHEE
ncbi:molybdopterin-guanine dinucleotide biosynthesis protein B [Aquibacillus koreensis]|uniref:Molybdopterin-guanine dinucleotide biosynthesis protein B n=1 Tax=Aquibacillus koreensis TaxID=279446 RepID=A0A9X3WN27_9BACI|nr:molybdopterin-guanine dinucleotide biosynthesis protein B [Aquibacillus koreensis]MCT2535890.1 molybdopterin-guanine dinucleotide biosynthesis protein B [Aquibacillus koreensis]MDC3420346.1 molybdopterin-guanine dinucleotide biosynthesis protein B [Aquibacillus koreensis]